jgi:cobalt/nickel transport protein
MKINLKWWHAGLLLVLLVACLAPLASSSPDGLERVAEDEGFIEKAEESHYHIIADYVFPWIENEALATVLAAIIGVLVIFVLAYSIGWVLRRGNRGSQ